MKSIEVGATGKQKRRTAGQIIKRGHLVYLLRVFLGRDENGKRRYANETFYGPKSEARSRLRELLRIYSASYWKKGKSQKIYKEDSSDH